MNLIFGRSTGIILIRGHRNACGGVHTHSRSEKKALSVIQQRRSLWIAQQFVTQPTSRHVTTSFRKKKKIEKYAMNATFNWKTKTEIETQMNLNIST